MEAEVRGERMPALKVEEGAKSRGTQAVCRGPKRQRKIILPHPEPLEGTSPAAPVGLQTCRTGTY